MPKKFSVRMKSKALEASAGELVDLTATVTPFQGTTQDGYFATWYASGQGEFKTFSGTPAKIATFVDTTGTELVATESSTPKLDIVWSTAGVPVGSHTVSVWVYEKKVKTLKEFIKAHGSTGAPLDAEAEDKAKVQIDVVPAEAQPLRVTMRRADVPRTSDQALWTVIRNSTKSLGYQKYSDFMDYVLCGDTRILSEQSHQKIDDKKRLSRLRLPFPDVDAYRQLKAATEVFMMLNCGVGSGGSGLDDADFGAIGREELEAEGRRYYRAISPGGIERYWNQYLEDSAGSTGSFPTLPYLALIRRKLKDVSVVSKDDTVDGAAVACMEILMRKLTMPCFLELIWSYWHEEGMLVQTMNAITWRFQNRRGPTDRDPLALLEIDPLRSLNNFIWGYIQDEQHRLTVPRRAYEYDHHYGFTLLGKAVPQVRGADSRTRFLEAFHHLLFVCSVFLKEDDDTTVVADGFPVLNALKEVHLLLTQGAHNQYGDLPWTARQEMLMQEWMLGRPEFREFLPRRIMVDYPEDWMDSVETMKSLQGWTDTSVMHFRDLGVFGEQILLGIRFGAWPGVIESEQAANWVRYWRPEIQGYIHAYRAVTGADLTDRVDTTMPAVLLKRRAAPQALPEGARAALPEPRRGLPDYARGPQASQRSLPSKTTR